MTEIDGFELVLLIRLEKLPEPLASREIKVHLRAFILLSAEDIHFLHVCKHDPRFLG